MQARSVKDVRMIEPTWLLVGGVVVCSGVALAIWMIFVEPYRFTVREVDLPTISRPSHRVAVEAPELAPLTVLHITDTHFNGKDEKKLGFLEEVSQRDYDLVFYTGDLIDTPEGVESCRKAAGYFQPKLGSFGVLGGHDHYKLHPFLRYLQFLNPSLTSNRYGKLNPAEDVVDALSDAGVHVLQDESTLIDLPGGGRCAIIGLRDSYLFRPSLRAGWEDVPDDVPVIVLSHSPDVLPELLRRRADLAFFGHTHGGQVRLPLVGALMTRSNLPGRRASGTFKRYRTVYTLNNGLGATEWLSYRLLCRPEVTVVHLTE